MNPRLSLLVLVATALLVSSSLAKDSDTDAKPNCFRNLLPEELAEAKLFSRTKTIVKSTKILPGSDNTQQLAKCLQAFTKSLKCSLNTTPLIEILASSPNAADALPAVVNYVDKYANDEFREDILAKLKACSADL